MEVYLDNAATAPLSQETKKYLISILDKYGNPSSLYDMGKESKQVISDARKAVGGFINAEPGRIFFTPGGSASNTLAINGFLQGDDGDGYAALYSPIAHKSVLKCVEGFKHTPLKVDRDGFIDKGELERLCLMHRKSLAVVDYANSEIGVIQDMGEIIDIVHFYGGMVYVDATGSIPTVPLDVEGLGIDMCGFSAHKLGGLKGCGILYKKPQIKLRPLIYGAQESGLVGGTENVLGIASLIPAIGGYDYSSVSPKNRDYVYRYIMGNIPDSYLVGTMEHRLPHNLYMCFKYVDGESLLYLLDMDGIQVSTGSACNSESIDDSAALKAIGFDGDDIRSCIRMTFSGKETKDELDYVCKSLEKCVSLLRGINGRV